MTNIAIIQSGPVYNDMDQSAQKAETLIIEAAKEGADIVAFGECWLTGYPAWLDYSPNAGLWDHDPVKEAWANMYENSLEVPGKHLDHIQKLAKAHGIHIILGANEVLRTGKGNGTLYNVVLQINKKGHLVNHHRKLMPTYTEKLIYGMGDGAGLRAVDTEMGRIGELICWEHWMPLTRQAMHDEAEDIHFALWPCVKEMNQIAARHYAFEGRCFVVSIGQMMKVSETPDGIELPTNMSKDKNAWVLNGGSCVCNPDGSWLLEPQYDREEIIYVEVPSLRNNIKERMNLAVSGHYSRNDVFKFKVKRG